MSRMIDGKAIAASVREEVKNEVEKLLSAGFSAPGLAVLLVGENPASKVYVRNKSKACESAGFFSTQINLSETISEAELLATLDSLNKDKKIDGILLQLPLPKHLNEQRMLRAIDPDKDVDGFHPLNAGKLAIGEESFVPCTPAGMVEILRHENIEMRGKEVVIVGRSNIVGKPMALLALRRGPWADATVTVCHSSTPDLGKITRRADILIAAVGIAKLIKADMVKEGAVVLDVGINRTEDGKLCGDVDYDAVFSKASAITPVPGGVGPMTIAMLLKNTLEAKKRHLKN